MSGLKPRPISDAKTNGDIVPAEQDAEKVASADKSRPQRLKPEFKSGICGTAEAVPLSKTVFVGGSQRISMK
jgi:hypothetical protein